MKIRYSTQKITSLSRSVLIDQAVYILKKENYAVEVASNNIINFKTSGGSIGTTGKFVGRLRKGQIEFSTQKEETLITLNYSISLITQITIILIFAIIGIFILPFLIFDSMILFLCLVSFITTKTGAEDLLNKIVSNTNH